MERGVYAEAFLAEEGGFEPTGALQLNGFSGRRNKPLCHSCRSSNYHSNGLTQIYQ